MNLSTSPNVLFMAPNSPFARMPRIVVLMNPELKSRIQIVAEDISSRDKKSADLMIDNPLGKVPKLAWEQTTILDSKRILMYLAGVLENPDFTLKNDTEEKIFETARSIMDLARANFYERKKEPINEETIFQNNQVIKDKIIILNEDYAQLESTQKITAVTISIICALDYVKNRGLFDWTQIANIEILHSLHGSLSQLPEFRDTVPAKAI